MARKNANGEGSRPRKRPDGRWEARYWSEGRRRSVYSKTRREVADKLAEALAGALTEGEVLLRDLWEVGTRGSSSWRH